MDFPLPANEARRARALHAQQILDTTSERVFDELTELAALICGTPISLISLVDEHRQWFKSRHGLEATETPREQAFCTHAILGDELLVVPDAVEDARFAENPLVQGEPGIRFYAGAPLTVGKDLRLGTLCVIDRVPRQLDENQRNALRILANSVQSLIELRRARMDLEKLRSLVPMCAWCRSVRVEGEDDAKPDWVPLHRYVEDRISVSHGLCPGCREEHFTS